MLVEIRNRFDNSIILCGEYESIKKCLEKNRMADLSGANLSRADLSRADLSGADLSGANLSRADLHGADLSRADLRGADLSRADLSGANLSRADLHGANLHGANLSGEKLDKTPIQLLGLKYFILITKLNIHIGCESHSIKEWNDFSDEEISKMDTGALEWWKVWKPVIMELNKKHC